MPKAITRISKRELEKRLSAAREVFPYAFPGVRRRYMNEPKPSKLAKSRRSLASMLLPPQFDAKRFEKLEKEYSLELNRIGKQREDAAVKASARKKRTLLAHAESTRKELGRVERLALLDPFLIWGRVYNPQFSSLKFDFDLPQHWAKMRFVGKQPWGDPGSGTFDTGELSFYYVWTNDSNYPIRISAATSLLLNGFCRARADGWWGAWGNPGKSALLHIQTALRAWQWWTNPPIPFPGSPDDVLVHEVELLTVEGGIWASAQERAIGEADFFSVSNIEVPQRGSVVFQVSLWSAYSFNGSGEILVDFSSGSFELRSLYLSLSIGRPPFPHPFPFPP